MGENPVDDRLMDDDLFVVTSRPDWYAGIVEFLTTQTLPEEWSKEERRKVRVNSRHFMVLGHRLFRRRTDGLLRRCVSATEVPSILLACHDSACGGHFSGQLTGQKILRAGYFWPTLFKDSHDYVKKCDVWQRYARNDLRMEMPLHVSLPLVPFEKWGIDYVGLVHPHSSRGMVYIVVATEYLTKWAEAKVVKTDTAAHAATFMYENIITRFGCPKILVSDRGTHFLNDLIREMTNRFQIDHRKTTPYHPQTNGQTERVNGILVSILRKTVIDSKRDWDVKLTAALWAYRTTYKVTTHATPFSLVYGLEATLPIEYEVESLRVAIGSRLIDKQSLKNRLTDLEELDERRRTAAQHIEAIQRRRKIIFDKRHKKRALQPGMMVMIQDARKLEFPAKFDAVWLGPYLVQAVFPNNSLQLETLNGELFSTRTSGSRCKEYKA
jgi:transposase InsO family protein